MTPLVLLGIFGLGLFKTRELSNSQADAATTIAVIAVATAIIWDILFFIIKL